jgi:uncharacterized cupredoxin-like copper-binding protein
MQTKVLAVFAFAATLSANAFGQGGGRHHAHDHSKGAETSFGRAADPAKAQRTIVVETRDFEFSPSEITVKAGEIVRFVVTNAGKQPHEMVLGTMQDLKEHNEMMKQHPGMHHDAPHMVHVAPGKSGIIVWQFTKPGEFYFGCFIENHFEIGMIGRIRVTGHPVSEESGQHEMRGMYGGYSMSRESSGTSWQPDASPHQGIHATYGDWSAMTHGFANLIYDRQGGPRGDRKTFSTSMLMMMGQRPVGGGTLGLRAMVSADPLFGKGGYPLLLQTGETGDGRTPLIDRQHPHDLFMELAATYSHKISDNSSVFGYAGLPGEPALGPPAFMHRFSGEDNPEAPISHHWLDSTHIAYGVVTLGYVFRNMKIEGSAFRGREPDQFRYNIETGKLDSTSLRLSYNPAKSWALQVSRAHIKSPEQLHADDDVDRTTASVIYNRAFGASNWQTTLAWGRNAASHGTATNAYLLESAIRTSKTHTFFGRAERADKNELFLPGTAFAQETFRVGKLSLGYLYDFPSDSHFKFGIGGLVSRFFLPSDLQSTYGGSPTSYMLFGRVKIK